MDQTVLRATHTIGFINSIFRHDRNLIRLSPLRSEHLFTGYEKGIGRDISDTNLWGLVRNKQYKCHEERGVRGSILSLLLRVDPFLPFEAG